MIPLRDNTNIPPRNYPERTVKATEPSKSIETSLPYKWQKKGDRAVDPNASWQKEGPIPLKGVKALTEQHRLELDLREIREIRSRRPPRLPVREQSDAFVLDKIKGMLPRQEWESEPKKKLLIDLFRALTPDEVSVLDNATSPVLDLDEVKRILKIQVALFKIKEEEQVLHQSPHQAAMAPLVHTRAISRDDETFLLNRIKALLPEGKFVSAAQKQFLVNLIQTLSPEKVKVLAKHSPIADRKEVAEILENFAKLLAKMPTIPPEEEFNLHMRLNEEFIKLEPYFSATKLSSTAITKTALAFRASQAASSHAKSHPLTSMETSYNEVFRVENANKTLTAYFKEDAPLEPIFWKCANLLNLDGLFVGAKKTRVKTTEGKNVTGSVQYSQEGVLYRESLRDAKLPQPNRQAIHDGVVAAITMGTFDLHSGNILVDRYGNIHLFDQTRSLPNTNAFLDRGSGKLVSPFRCALLASEYSLFPLSAQEKQALKETFQNLLGNVDSLNAFLKSDYGLAMLAEVPSGWLDPDGAVGAMRERLERAILAIDDPKTRNLRDLCLAINPYFKFNIILSVAQMMREDLGKNVQRSPIEIEKQAHRSVGKESFNALLHACAVYGFNLEALEEMAFDDTSMEEIATYILDVVSNNKLMKTSTDETPMLEKYQANSGIDSKDFRTTDASTRIIKYFKDQGNRVYDIEKGFPDLPKGQFALTHSKGKGKNKLTAFSVIMNDKRGVNILEMDPYLTPNSYTLKYKSVPLSPLSPEEMVEFLEGRIFPSVTHEMAIIDRLDGLTEELYSQSHKEARKDSLAMEPGNYFIYHLQGSRPPRFFGYFRTIKGVKRYEIDTEDPNNYQFTLNRKVIANIGSTVREFKAALAIIAKKELSEEQKNQ